LWKIRADKVISPGAVRGGKIYGSNYSGRAGALNASNGTKIWSTAWGDLPATLVALSGTYFVVTDGQGVVAAIDVRTGKLIWTKTIDCCDVAMIAWHNMLFLGNEGGTIQARDARTGRLIWTVHSYGLNIEALAVGGGRLYANASNNSGRWGISYAFRPRDGRLLWKRPGLSIQLSYFHGMLYGYDLFNEKGSNNFHCVNPSNGKTMWTVDPNAYLVPVAGQAVGNGYAYVTFENGIVLTINLHTRRPAWRANVHSYTSPPSLAGGVVYVGSYHGSTASVRQPAGCFGGFTPRTGLIRTGPSSQTGNFMRRMTAALSTRSA
jgi:outer membrane protein assembly factor BamB